MRSQLTHYDPLKSLMPLSLSPPRPRPPPSSVDWSMPWSDPLSSRQDSTIACRYCRMRKVMHTPDALNLTHYDFADRFDVLASKQPTTGGVRIVRGLTKIVFLTR